MAYAEKRAANPGALGLTIGLNVAAVAAIAAWNPSVFHIPPPPWTTVDIPPIDPPPPPIEDTKIQSKRQIDRPKATIETGGTIERWREVDIDPGPIILEGGGAGTGGGIIIDPPPPPPHQIVKRGAAMTTSPSEMQPPYPPGLQRQEVEGSVTVRVLVGTDGRPRDIVLIRADHPDFFAATKSWGMRHWRFKPASEDNLPVDGSFTLNVRFTIN